VQNPRALARLAVAGIVVYVVIDVALVFLRPRFSVLHNAESDYGSRGPENWLKLHLLFAGIAFVAVIVGARMTTRALRPDVRWRPVIVPLGVLSWGRSCPSSCSRTRTCARNRSAVSGRRSSSRSSSAGSSWRPPGSRGSRSRRQGRQARPSATTS
jgi:Protein of unknown function (DUF998)